MNHFGLSATASWPPAATSSSGYGETDIDKWMWQLEEDTSRDPDEAAPTPSIDASFTVKILTSEPNPHSGSEPQDSPDEITMSCVPCPKCGRAVHETYAHSEGVCTGLRPPDLGPSFAEGCGQRIWACDPQTKQEENELHRERTCNRPVLKENPQNPVSGFLGDYEACGVKYRNCTPNNNNLHGENNDVPHMDDWSFEMLSGMSPSSGSYTANPGDTHEANLVADGPYSQVYWYAKAPGDTSSYGTQVEIDNGDGITSEASLSYTFPSGVTGEHTITAYIYRSDLSVYEESYTVTVESVTEDTGQ